jgi:hypothetical protein
LANALSALPKSWQFILVPFCYALLAALASAERYKESNFCFLRQLAQG